MNPEEEYYEEEEEDDDDDDMNIVMDDDERDDDSEDDFDVLLEDPVTPLGKAGSGGFGGGFALGSEPAGIPGQTPGSAGSRGRVWSRTGAAPLAPRPTLTRPDGYVPTGYTPQTAGHTPRDHAPQPIADAVRQPSGSATTPGAAMDAGNGEEIGSGPQRETAPPPPEPQHELPELPWNGSDGPLIGRSVSLTQHPLQDIKINNFMSSSVGRDTSYLICDFAS
jgi:hypothetical protein